MGILKERTVEKMADMDYEKVKKMIEEGHLRYFSFVDAWKEICPALILHFDNREKVIIQEEKWPKILNLL